MLPPPSSTLMVRADIRADVGPVDQAGFLGGTATQLEPGPSLFLVPGGGLRGSSCCRLPSARFSHTLICSHLMSSYMLSLAPC